MKILCAEIEIDGNLMKGVVVDVSEDGAVRSVIPLSTLPCEPANTVYFGGKARIVEMTLQTFPEGEIYGERYFIGGGTRRG